MTDISKLRALMRQLRDRDHGCPWDLAQTYRTIVPHTLEEAYEVADTIESDRLESLPDELGDLLFQVVFYCQLGEEQARFSFDDVVAAIEDKLIRRHPHVFATQQATDAPSVALAWEAHKASERRAAHADSELDQVAVALLALSRAAKIQKRAARVGFDWPDVAGAWAKLDEEITELRDACTTPDERAAIADELGDVLFAVVNVARHLDVGAEACLRAATAKFERRFRAVEQLLAARDSSVAEADAELLDELWESVKRDLRQP